MIPSEKQVSCTKDEFQEIIMENICEKDSMDEQHRNGYVGISKQRTRWSGHPRAGTLPWDYTTLMQQLESGALPE